MFNASYYAYDRAFIGHLYWQHGHSLIDWFINTPLYAPIEKTGALCLEAGISRESRPSLGPQLPLAHRLSEDNEMLAKSADLFLL